MAKKKGGKAPAKPQAQTTTEVQDTHHQAVAPPEKEQGLLFKALEDENLEPLKLTYTGGSGFSYEGAKDKAKAAMNGTMIVKMLSDKVVLAQSGNQSEAASSLVELKKAPFYAAMREPLLAAGVLEFACKEVENAARQPTPTTPPSSLLAYICIVCSLGPYLLGTGRKFDTKYLECCAKVTPLVLNYLRTLSNEKSMWEKMALTNGWANVVDHNIIPSTWKPVFDVGIMGLKTPKNDLCTKSESTCSLKRWKCAHIHGSTIISGLFIKAEGNVCETDLLTQLVKEGGMAVFDSCLPPSHKRTALNPAQCFGILAYLPEGAPRKLVSQFESTITPKQLSFVYSQITERMLNPANDTFEVMMAGPDCSHLECRMRGLGVTLQSGFADLYSTLMCAYDTTMLSRKMKTMEGVAFIARVLAECPLDEEMDFELIEKVLHVSHLFVLDDVDNTAQFTPIYPPHTVARLLNHFGSTPKEQYRRPAGMLMNTLNYLCPNNYSYSLSLFKADIHIPILQLAAGASRNPKDADLFTFTIATFSFVMREMMANPPEGVSRDRLYLIGCGEVDVVVECGRRMEVQEQPRPDWIGQMHGMATSILEALVEKRAALPGERLQSSGVQAPNSRPQVKTAGKKKRK